MTKRTKHVDLEALCQQVFSGVYPSHGEAIISERRALLFNEASKSLYLSGYSDSEIEEELSKLQSYLEEYLNSAEKGSAGKANNQTSASEKVGLSDAQIEEIRDRQINEDKPEGEKLRPESKPQPDKPSRPEPTSRPNKFIRFVVSGFQFLLAMVAIGAVTFGLGTLYSQLTKIEHPSLSYPGSIDNHYKEALVDCKNEVISREHLGNSHPEYLGSADADSEAGYVGGGKVAIRFSDAERDCISIRQYAKFKKRQVANQEYEARTGIKVYSPEYWDQLRLESWQDDYRHKIIAQLEEISPIVDCHIDTDEMPHRDDRSLVSSDVQEINQWISGASEQFDQCLSTTLSNAPEDISNLIVSLVGKLNKDEGIEHERNYDFLSNDKLIRDAHFNAQKKWVDAINEQSNKVFNNWDRFRNQVIEPRAERGARLEREWARERAEEKYAKEFKQKYGKNPDDPCDYKGRTVRCDQAPWVTNPLRSWDDVNDSQVFFDTLNSMNQRYREQQHRQQKLNQAYQQAYIEQLSRGSDSAVLTLTEKKVEIAERSDSGPSHCEKMGYQEKYGTCSSDLIAYKMFDEARDKQRQKNSEHRVMCKGQCGGVCGCCPGECKHISK